MIKGDHDYLQNLAKFNVCAEHHTELIVAWHSGEKCWTLRCGEGEHRVTKYVGEQKIEIPNMPILGHYPDAITRQLSLTQEYKAGEPLPGHIEDKVKKRQRREAKMEGKQPVEEQFALLPRADLGTGELLTPEVLTALVGYAERYHLDARRGHVVLMYGKPYIGIDGYLYYAKRLRVPYTLESRPMITKEFKEYKIGATDHAWLAKVIFTETGDTFTGVGIVTYEEMTAKSPRDDTKLRSPVVAAHPWQLAQKRAEWQALRRAFPIGESEE